MSRIYSSAEQLIGNTPLMEIRNIAREDGLKSTVLVKLECFNPAGSVKDRVAKAMIDLMGGTVTVESADGAVEFVIRLPIESVPAGNGANGGDKELGSLKMLVVDDNEVNREIANLLLTGEGHEVELAENGAEAVEKVSSSGGRYDVVFMDVQMPVMNGFEATAAIRALPDEALASIPIIAMTANAYQEDKNEALDAGMDGYITKPINPDDIRAVLIKVLAK